MRVVADIEIWNEAEHPLFLFILNLLLRHFHLGQSNLHFGKRGGDRQCDWRDGVDLSRVQISRRRLRPKSGGSDGELERPSRDVEKRELPVVVGQRIRKERLILMDRLDNSDVGA